MDYIKIRFGNDLGKLGSRFEDNFEQSFQAASSMYILKERSWKPQMDIYETPELVIIAAEIAGVKKEDLELEINSKAVQIKGIRLQKQEDQKTRYRLAEIQYGSFKRILYLPAVIDTKKVSASYQDGFLRISLKKLLDNKTYKIPIQSD